MIRIVFITALLALGGCFFPGPGYHHGYHGGGWHHGGDWRR